MCSVYLLNRTLSQQQWVALVFLTSGVGIVQLYSIDNGSPSSSSTSTLADSNAPSQTLGLLAVVLACLSSGFASCFFEKVLKAPGTVAAAYKPSVWVRNVQLSCFGLAAGLPIVLWEMRDTWIENGGFEASTAVWTFFDGFNSVTWIVIFLQVTGGLLGGEFWRRRGGAEAEQALWRSPLN
jgi:solute carrier family 35 (UDP-sugar transporter), member A1/2/3